MNKSLTIKFLEEYRKNPSLWNTKCKEYNDRKLKKQSYDKLISLLKPTVVNVDKNYIVKKINTLRCCFRKEYRKVLDSLVGKSSNTDTYKPSLWYYDLLLFTIDDKTQIPKSEKNEFIYQILEETEECKNLNELNNQQDDNSIHNEEQNQNENMFIDIVDTNNKRLKIEPEHINSNNTTQSIINLKDSSDTFNLTLLKESERIIQRDEFDTFGVLVASKLRKIARKNESQQLFCENIINHALMKGLLGKLTEDSVIDC